MVADEITIDFEATVFDVVELTKEFVIVFTGPIAEIDAETVGLPASIERDDVGETLRLELEVVLLPAAPEVKEAVGVAETDTDGTPLTTGFELESTSLTKGLVLESAALTTELELKESAVLTKGLVFESTVVAVRRELESAALTTELVLESEAIAVRRELESAALTTGLVLESAAVTVERELEGTTVLELDCTCVKKRLELGITTGLEGPALKA